MPLGHMQYLQNEQNDLDANPCGRVKIVLQLSGEEAEGRENDYQADTGGKE